MSKFKSINGAIAIVAVSFPDGTYQAYSGKISEIEVYKEDDDLFFSPATINLEKILKLRFPQGFTSTISNENINQSIIKITNEGELNGTKVYDETESSTISAFPR